ncbi:MAG: hypothetical protein Q8835_03660, partial [Sweet potato little leaf phytoplasma]|nr:hypothetical protein [Sweet potato little leaf phytoplasma]
MPIIFASDLMSEDDEVLIKLLQQYRKVIGWTLADIQGISPSFYMHKITLEEGSFRIIEQQRRLNPAMKEVVKKEVIKWLDVGIIYPIADSNWVSPVQCVPKKEGV